MRYGFVLVWALLFSISSFADELRGDLLIVQMKENNNFSVFFENPADESARTIVFCFSSEDEARRYLAVDRVGGVALFKGTHITLKVDALRTFKTGTNLKAAYVQIECGT